MCDVLLWVVDKHTQGRTLLRCGHSSPYSTPDTLYRFSLLDKNESCKSSVVVVPGFEKETCSRLKYQIKRLNTETKWGICPSAWLVMCTIYWKRKKHGILKTRAALSHRHPKNLALMSWSPAVAAWSRKEVKEFPHLALIRPWSIEVLDDVWERRCVVNGAEKWGNVWTLFIFKSHLTQIV